MLGIRIGLTLLVNMLRIAPKELYFKFLVIGSSTVQYSVMASRTSNQAWSKGLDAGTYRK